VDIFRIREIRSVSMPSPSCTLEFGSTTTSREVIVSTFPNQTWLRSRHGRCETAACVEVSRSGETVLVRDSKDPASPVLRFTIAEWNSFVAGIRAGDFELD
jgi:hypothetical protein